MKSKNSHLFGLFVATLLYAALVSGASAQQKQDWGRITVLELLTSGGCQDSPPADALFSQIINDPDYANKTDFIAFSCHVTYFDDPYAPSGLSSPLCDERHQLYMQFGTEAASTPAMMMNGVFHMGGKRESVIRAGINMSRVISDIARVQIFPNAKTLMIGMPDLGRERQLEVWLIGYRKSAGSYQGYEQPVCAASGFANVATHIEKLFSWNGKPLNAEIALGTLPIADGYIVLAQPALFSQNTPDIIAAGKYEKPGMPSWLFAQQPQYSEPPDPMLGFSRSEGVVMDVDALNALMHEMIKEQAQE